MSWVISEEVAVWIGLLCCLPLSWDMGGTRRVWGLLSSLTWDWHFGERAQGCGWVPSSWRKPKAWARGVFQRGAAGLPGPGISMGLNQWAVTGDGGTSESSHQTDCLPIGVLGSQGQRSWLRLPIPSFCFRYSCPTKELKEINSVCKGNFHMEYGGQAGSLQQAISIKIKLLERIHEK